MWAAFVRQFAAYAITRRGKKLFAPDRRAGFVLRRGAR